jgi:NRPS condensation-like uncharacterized protein
MKKDHQENKKKLADMIQNQPAKLPIQEVKPVQQSKEQKKEAHMNFWIEEEIMERLKIHSIKSKKTIKQIAKEALSEYLEKYDK